MTYKRMRALLVVAEEQGYKLETMSVSDLAILNKSALIVA